MSLIRVRRKRKKTWIDHHKSKSPEKLLFLLAFVVAVIWWLGWRF